MESLGINIKLLLAQVINFFLFFLIFRKFISKPFSKFLDTEIKNESEKDRILVELKKKEEAVITLEARMKEKVKKEYDLQMKQVKEEAQKIKASLAEEAKKTADEIIERGKKQTENERELMYKEMKKKIMEISLALVAKGLSQFLNKNNQKEVTQYILKNLPKDLN